MWLDSGFMYGRPNRCAVTQAAIAAVMQYGADAVNQVPPPVYSPRLRSKAGSPPAPISEARWRAMLTRIRLYGEPGQFKDDYE